MSKGLDPVSGPGSKLGPDPRSKSDRPQPRILPVSRIRNESEFLSHWMRIKVRNPSPKPRRQRNPIKEIKKNILKRWMFSVDGWVFFSTAQLRGRRSKKTYWINETFFPTLFVNLGLNLDLYLELVALKQPLSGSGKIKSDPQKI